MNEEYNISNFIKNIKNEGYSTALKKFLENNLELESKFEKMEGSIAFRVNNNNNSRCLIINSDFGNIPENLSHTFEQVWSFEENSDKTLIQKYRFENKKIKNITIINTKKELFTFPKNYFELIILNGIKQVDVSIGFSNYIEMIRTLLTEDGCMCVGVHNKYGINLFRKENDNHGEEKEIVESINGYKKIFETSGFEVKPYWVFPSHTKPHYSANIEDDVSLEWFFENFDKTFSVDKKFSMIRNSLKILNSKSRKILVEKFAPSFLFYCYKNNIPENIESMIIKKSGLKNCIQNIRHSKIMYILLDSIGIPQKAVFCKLEKFDLKENIVEIQRKFPNMREPDEKIMMEDWVSGDVLDPSNKNDFDLTMKWIIKFQEETKSELLTLKEIERESEDVKNNLKRIDAMSSLPFEKWIDDYNEYVNSLKLKKTAVHGDFQTRNILIDRKNSLVNIIDWDWRFQEKGNPTYDFVWLGTNLMIAGNNMIDSFVSHLNGKGKHTESIKILKDIMNIHFKQDFDFIRLQRFMILRFITIKINDGTLGYLSYIELLKILSKKTSN
tara:strand:+ start:2323 stop:3990 length:1668 start_codon:yes stop_codon:yes gene_type:complete